MAITIWLYGSIVQTNCGVDCDGHDEDDDDDGGNNDNVTRLPSQSHSPL